MCCFIGTLFYALIIIQDKRRQHWTLLRVETADQQNLPVTAVPTIDAFVTVKPQISFFQQNYFDEICSTPTYVANAIYSVASFLNLSVTVSTFHILDAPILYQDQ